ncbi:uncharacterized protein LOC109831220 [Asparagus officinalis]|uniref:uncharacterized protein LOC109831220 n=1 Tax=Asparagus officinalis TaxID=4686 RepID=UPI00098E5918|nr:uncharacterized protein LOC109831220 [Asparagus officinalis]
MVRNHISQYHLSFIALIETKIKESLLDATAKKIAKKWKWLSTVRGSEKARILILWDQNFFDIQVIKNSDQHITCYMKSLDGRLSCIVSTVYGFNRQEARKELWEDLKQISQNIRNVPWRICGDYNCLLSNEEKLGGINLTEADTKDFKKFIEDCNLRHLKTQGCFYTWNNKQDANSRIWCRLDRALINDAWIDEYISSHVEFMLPNLSDHSPAIVSVYDDLKQGKKPFKFFKMWTKHENYIPTVSKIWHTHVQGYTMYSVYAKLKMLKKELIELNKKHFHNISEQVQRAKFALEDAQRILHSDPLNSDFIAHKKKCILTYNKLLDCELSFYRQKTRINWNVHGDRSSKLFQSIAKYKRHNNRILALYNSKGDKITDDEGIVQELTSYYKNLMGKAINTLPPDINIIKSGPCLNDAKINELLKPVSKVEIKVAVFSIPEDQ